jgi:hypothetical protein
MSFDISGQWIGWIALNLVAVLLFVTAEIAALARRRRRALLHEEPAAESAGDAAASLEDLIREVEGARECADGRSPDRSAGWSSRVEGGGSLPAVAASCRRGSRGAGRTRVA